MSQTTDSNSNGFQFRTEPMPTTPMRSRGKWIEVVEKARQASAQGHALVWECDGSAINTARSTLYGHKSLLPGETVHITYAGGVIRVWITKATGR